MDEYSSGFCIKATRDGGVGTGTKCGRWNPTNEQVKVLTELFRSGLRTPSTDQIQKISSQLSVYGKIESKNVFYWFQNHKARERQKRRRVSIQDQDKNHIQDNTKLSSTKYYTDEVINIDDHVVEPKRVMETLQLFPLNSLTESTHSEKLWRNGSFAYNFNIGAREIEYQPTLDLRLSFV